jgi:hypothetical protein
MLAPVVDIMLVYGLVFWELRDTVTAWLGMLCLQLFTAAVAFRFDRESLRPLLRLPLQQFAYRQLMYLVLIQSATTALTGGRLRWHKLNRAGLTPRSPSPEPPAAGGSVAPMVDSWPPARADRPPSAPRQPVGRAVAPPAVPPQPRHSDDLPSAGSPPSGGYSPVHARWTPDQRTGSPTDPPGPVSAGWPPDQRTG